MLLNWGARDDWEPTFVDLDVGGAERMRVRLPWCMCSDKHTKHVPLLELVHVYPNQVHSMASVVG